MKIFFVIILCCLFSTAILAQHKIANEREKIDSLFRIKSSRSDFRDTNMVYMFALKVSVSKSPNGQAKVLSLQASDSAAFRIYKDLKFLKEIDYSLFMGKKAKATFVFPVCILLEYPDKPNAGYINMQELQRKMEFYWFRRDYFKEPTDQYIYIPISVSRTSTVASY